MWELFGFDHEESFEENVEDFSCGITEEVSEESLEEADEIAEMKQEKEDRQTRKITAIGGIIFVAFLLLIAISKLIPSGPKYEFILEGNTVQIPCSYYDFEDLGFEMVSEYKMYNVSSGDTTWVKARNSAGKEIELILLNDTMSEQKTRGCKVIGISVNEGKAPNFRLINDVKLGMSYNQVNDIMGVGGSTTYGSNTYTEQVGSDIYNIRISYENPVISIDSGTTSYMDYDSLTYYAMNNFWNRKVTSISVRLEH
ncbi:MAG: hypothetical protein J6C06_10285 [Lachnospiraceae bacterium]|nr:hypothetical protein [Lachnospiraceae bacterium]